ncbi:Uncharacterised protein [Fusobacterium necrophorum subsp. necrophorum]|nr:Uncharacterised protein [Fusobacterium necrophorum subsp. necrophorum]
MFLLGIDIAKLNHVASCFDSSTNEIVFSNFKFKNDFNGFSALLKKYPSTEEIAALKEDDISNLLYASSKGHFKKEKSLELKSLAKTSVGMKDSSISFHVIQ